MSLQLKRHFPVASPSLSRPLTAGSSSPSWRAIVRRALLVTDSLDSDLRRAGLQQLRLLSKRARTTTHQRGSSDGAVLINRTKRSRALSNASSSFDRAAGEHEKIELHLLALGDVEEGEEEVVLNVLRATGVSVFVHRISSPSRGGGNSSRAPNLPLSVERATTDGSILDKALQQGIDSFALVLSSSYLDSIPSRDDEMLQSFLELVAAHCSPPGPKRYSLTTPSHPSVTLYIPSRPMYGNFDFDDNDSEPIAERLARRASETLTSLIRGSVCTATEWSEAKQGLSLPATSLRRASGLSEEAKRMLFPPIPDHRPLLLRPAPGPGPQSLTMRLPVWDGAVSDLILKVEETTTPIEDDVRFSWPSSSEPTSTAGSKSRGPPPPRPPKSVARFPRRHLPPTPPASPPSKLRIMIPATPPLLFDDENTPSSSPTSSSTSSISSKAFHPELHSPLIKFSFDKPLERKDTFASSASTEDDPRWGRIRGLLRQRRKKQHETGDEAEEELEQAYRGLQMELSRKTSWLE